MIDWYILEPDHTVRKAVSMEEASAFLADRNNKIILQQVGAGGRFVSTVFLGLDHGWMGGPPLVFETMIFEKGWLTKERPKINWKKLKARKQRPNERTDIHDWQDRYSTYEEAIAGHVNALAILQREFPGNVYANKRRRRALQAAFIKRTAGVPDVLPSVIVHELGAFS
ncbi:hypothetical protein hairong_126 [Pseudomonas phage hairong]|nr:hypothetical protein hairong_126 [Pseudomonas phage hairong]